MRLPRLRTRTRVGVFVVPFDSNPYQEQLYRPMLEAHPSNLEIMYWRRIPWIGLPLFFPMSLWASIKGYRIAHVHWLAWDLRIAIPGSLYLSSFLTKLSIVWLKLLRFRLVWTVHNIVPHEPQTHHDLAIARSLSQSVDALLVHSESVLNALSLAGLTVNSAHVIPHGNYIDQYRNKPNQPEARKRLGLPEEERLLLYFGLMRKYKGVPDLLKVWNEDFPPGLLMLAGSCTDPALSNLIGSYQAGDPTIHCHLDFIPDEEVPNYFEACDAVCLPFRNVTTSGSALLALSFAKPIIAPRMGSLEDLPEAVGFFYKSSSTSGLSSAISRFFTADPAELRAKSESALEQAEQAAWPAIAETTFAVYSSIMRSSPQ